MFKRDQFRQYQEDAKTSALREICPGKPTLIHVPTGGGKTRIANDVIAEWIENGGGPVLWVSKDWWLDDQASRDLARRYPSIGHDLGRIGGDRTVLDRLPEYRNSNVYYSTLQTMGRRIPGYWHGRKPAFVVWDECHWAEHGKTGRRLLRWCADDGIPVLGLTATPSHPECSRFDLSYSISFLEILDLGYLARPIPIDPMETGVAWNPDRSGRYGDFTQESLFRLVNSTPRNDLIVRHFVENLSIYGKTILFACTVEHAELLAAAFERLGIPVSVVHYGRDNFTNKRAIQQFESGAVRLMINVSKLTHGVDIPDIKTVMLCRPTTSDRLFTQMVGRGSRICEGKDSFNIVEFTDNLDRFRDCLYTAKRFFEGSGLRGDGQGRRKTFSVPRRSSHGFRDSGAPRWIPDNENLPKALRGLWYREGQTFGIEFELTAKDFVPNMTYPGWQKKAEAIRQALVQVLPHGSVAAKVSDQYHGAANHSWWNVTWDGTCGWEVTSRILMNQEGFVEITRVCDALSEAAPRLGLHLNHRTGTHVHLGWRGRTVDEVKRAIKLAKLFEPALATLVAPSRIVRKTKKGYRTGVANSFCKPIATVFNNATLEKIADLDGLLAVCNSDRARCLTFNVKPIGDLHTVEVRMHNGTTEAAKILLWVSLWMQLLWAASKDRVIPKAKDRSVIVPDGDILSLATEHLPAMEVQNPVFLRRLHNRRSEVAARWRSTRGLKTWSRYAGRWDSRILGLVFGEDAA